MKIQRDAAKEKMLMDQIIASFAQPRPAILLPAVEERTGIHLSDLLSVRKTYFGKVSPQPITPDEALYFLAGRGHEDVFGRIAGFIPASSKIVDRISYRPDFRWFGLPTEFKTRRSNLAKDGEEAEVYESYLEQEKGYCALDESPLGILIVFSLLEGQRGDPKNPTHPEIAVYDVAFDPDELVQFRAELNVRKNNLLSSIAAEDVSNLPLCRAWLCGTPTKIQDAAPRCLTCAREFASQWHIDKHTAAKAGAGHLVIAEQSHWDYTPRCKWYEECKPWEVDPGRKAR